MCGLAGFLLAEELQDRDSILGCLRPMADAIAHRGPDGQGYWVDSEAGIALAHRRLSIVELSPAGHQPMVSHAGRYVLSYNGEIYNYHELRREMERSGSAPSEWLGHSDTEVLLQGFEAWGVQRTLQRARGMFAFALWDRLTRTLTLGRDRLGEKPLYYGWQGEGKNAVFLFGSDLAALKAHPEFEGQIDRSSLCLYLRHNCIGGERSIFQGISKLKPGCVLTVSARSSAPAIEVYWSAADVAERGVSNPFQGDMQEAVDQLEALLRQAIGQQMVSDVPLGAFLSGGIDSSTIVALMQAQSSQPVKTFSIGFTSKDYDEAPHAKLVAQHLGTDHTELYLSAEDAMNVIPELPNLYSEPFSDSSQIPTYLVSKLAREHVTVTLSGDAGDELFCGYTRYQVASRAWKSIMRIPLPLRSLARGSILSVSPRLWDGIGGYIGRRQLGDKLHKGANLLTSDSVQTLYKGLVSHWSAPEKVVLGAYEPVSQWPQLQSLNGIEQMMALDMITYLPDDILTKVDRASMAVSLESRVPFLDHRIVEFAWSLPLSYKLRNNITKWPLRQVLYRHVPRSVLDRPKMGFGVPIGEWLRRPLRDWAETLLSEQRLRDEGYFEPEMIRRKWTEHLSGRRNWQYHLWDILMFQSWLERARA